MTENKHVSDLLENLKKTDERTIKEAVNILNKMQTQSEYAIAVVYAIQNYFFGFYKSKGIFTDALDKIWERRLKKLYALDRLIQNNPDFDKIFRKIKKETSKKKIGFKVNNMARRIAFIWATIEQKNRD